LYVCLEVGIVLSGSSIKRGVNSIMRIAAIYDIHSNELALEAVLRDIQHEQPDLILVGGDIVPGPLPRTTLALLQQLGAKVRFIRGNGDREVVAAFDGSPLGESMPLEVREATQWVAQQLERSQRDFLANMPAQLTFTVDGLGDVLFCHATPRNDVEIFTQASPEERIHTMFAGVQQPVVICGHTHMQFERVVDGIRIINPGSVGMPYADQPGAYWALLGPVVTFKHTAYNLANAAERIRASGYPGAQEFADENVLKVPTTAEAIEVFERMAAKQE
jgi:putative phosphoesterase